MNNSILKQTTLFLAIVLTVMSCSNDELNHDYNIIGNWRVVSFNNNVTSKKITKTSENTWMDFNNGDITLGFLNPDDTKGIVYGRCVTNAFSGYYSIEYKGKIKMENFISTMINEPEWGRLFHVIEYVDEYVIEKDMLIMYYNNKKHSIVLERVVTD